MLDVNYPEIYKKTEHQQQIRNARYLINWTISLAWISKQLSVPPYPYAYDEILFYKAIPVKRDRLSKGETIS
jgi:hypothetical protein